MLDEYGMVYVKPDRGKHGKGVMKVENAEGKYRYQYAERKRNYRNYNEMAIAIRKLTRGRRYLVQRGIRLLTHKGRRFDLRVMAQWSPRSRWETTGIIGRVAAPRRIVTNYHSGGTLKPIQQLLGKRLNNRGLSGKIRELKRMGVWAGQAMQRKFPGVYEVGLDIGMDRSHTPWIIEVNTAPDPYIFRKLSDPTVFRKIRRYARIYNRL